MNTKEIYEELRKSVIGQDEYLKQLATISYKHLLKQKLIAKGLSPINSNLLVIGPSGCGKTFAAKKLANTIDVPFYEVDCSNLVQVGYKGSNSIEDALSDMIGTFKGNYTKAIIYLDEFDKIFDLALFKDGKGKGCQQNFLKLLEPNNITITRGERFSSRIPIDTSGFTFIATGSFENVKESIRQMKCSSMGFKSSDFNLDEIELSKQDLIDFGYMPELVGRFTNLVNINQLSENDFYEILNSSDSCIYRKYLDLFNMDNVKLSVSKALLRKIAEDSYNSLTGARNLEFMFSEIMDRCLYEVGCDETIRQVSIGYRNNKITCDYICGESRNLDLCNEQDISRQEVIDYVNDLIEDMDITISISRDLKKTFSSILLNMPEQFSYEQLSSNFVTIMNNFGSSVEVNDNIYSICRKVLDDYADRKEGNKDGK